MMPDTATLIAMAHTYAAATYAPPPGLVAARGAGSWLWDVAGKRYLDFVGGMGANVLGHAHPEVTAAIATQAQQLCHTSNALHHVGAIELAARLARLWPGHEGAQTFLCNSGTEAVEAALKLSRRYFAERGMPERTGFVAMRQGFHGRTYGALSVTGQHSYHRGFGPLVPDVTTVAYDDVDALRQAVTARTAAVIVEPIQGNGGVQVPSAGYLQAVRQICDAAGALFIADEVQTGVGRTGAWFACNHVGVVPDMLCLAKALGGGLPLGALVAKQTIMAAFGPGSHGSTFGGNPVACAAAQATLDVLQRDALVPRAQALGAQWAEALRGLPHVRQVRGQGLLVGVVCDVTPQAVLAACPDQGLLATRAGPEVVRMFAPLNVTEDELAEATQRLGRALTHAAKRSDP
jgi:predicted acetylornithine/succinylornithine family transaminase